MRISNAEAISYGTQEVCRLFQPQLFTQPGMEPCGGTGGVLGLKSFAHHHLGVTEAQDHPLAHISGSPQIITPWVLYLFLHRLYMEKHTTPSQLINIAHNVFNKTPLGTLNSISALKQK